jgi:predicted O-linked N-acetylglucosamine transferase (SPINDLY family)
MPLEPRPTPHQPHDPTRRLRIGYVSADYRDHTLAGFIGLLLKHHDRQQVEVFAYANVTRPDERTAELKALADHWRPIVGLMDRTIAEMIEADKIDVLIDLGGHTASNRLITFAYRPAALQATLFGYPNTTAVRAIDYRITDAISDPPGATEQLSTEQLLRLPRVAWCYSPPVGLPEPGPLPASQSRFFTFGCLNNSAKISDACLQLWATLLQSVPGTRLILMAGASQAGQRRLMDRFVRAGILRDRVVLLGRMPRDQYSAAYNDIDVALDPFPYNGGVTTCDALWMGVPVLSLAGTSYVARQGAMQLITLGLGAMLAADADGFLTLARGLTKRREELAGLRSRLRGILAQSPLCDATGYVRDLEATLRTAWQNTLPKSL